MTQFKPVLKPTLALSRLVVVRSGKHVYDEAFHPGVNVIRGENGSGKTTIADLISFSLGGEPLNWRSEALLCEYTIAEILVNGSPVTLKREISKNPSRPMNIFWGSFDAASRSATSGWELYQYAKRETKQSFSQALFTALGIPQVRGELSARITMHQLLRLMYSDQMTPVEQIFRMDSFDSALIRDAVGALLCGVYDERLYELQMAVRTASDELSSIDSKLKHVLSILSKAQQGLNLKYLHELFINKSDERKQLSRKLDEIGQNQIERSEASAERKKALETIQANLRKASERRLSFTDRLEELDFEISDSQDFIAALSDNLKALEDAAQTRTILGELAFSACPICSLPLDSNSPGHCALCKSPEDPKKRSEHLMRLKQEMSRQLEESAALQRDRQADRSRLASELKSVETEVDQLQYSYNELSTIPSSPEQAVIADTNRKIGYLERELQDIDLKIKLATSIDALSDKRGDLANAILKMRDEITSREQDKREKEVAAFGAIASNTMDLLKLDLKREDVFMRPQSVSFDFGSNKVFVDGKSNFAASSMTYLKNCFHLAILLASTEMAFFRYPRFLLLDNIEDKGMEEARSHNFQEILLTKSNSAPAAHQIIMTTSMVSPKLNIDGLTVGRYYTHEDKSLLLK